jgi:hypothetical protein
MTIPDSPINTPVASLGVEHRNPSDWMHPLSDTEKAELDSAIRGSGSSPAKSY